LSLADVAIVVDVYPAREKPIVGVTSEMITDEMKRIGHKNAHYIPNKEDIPHFLQEVTKPDDLVITMGAGDIWKYGEIFLTLK
jgi:UDP-N-acetylmuramate--alanine ligase